MDYIIRDFQAIQEAKLRVKGFTLVLGESSSGKSACLRAMYAATHNRFRNGQVRHGEDHATIMVKTEESNEVFTAMRPWAGSIKMKLGNENFNKIGRTLPKQINDFLNFGTLDVAGDNYSLHFHDQFQKPLLLEYSQKKVMDVLSASQGIDDLMEVKDKLSEVRAENKGAFKVVDGILCAANAQLSEVKKNLEDAESLVLLMSEKYSEFETVSHTEQKLVTLKSLVSLQEKLVTQQTLLNNLIEVASDLGSNEVIERMLEDVKSYVGLLNRNSKRCEVLTKFVNMAPLHLECTSKLTEFADLSKSYTELYYTTVRSRRIADRIGLLSSAVEKQANSNKLPFNELDTLKITLDSYNVIKGRFEELKNIVDNGLCPVCHSKVE